MSSVDMIKTEKIRHKKSEIDTWLLTYSDLAVQVMINPGYFTFRDMAIQSEKNIIILITEVKLDTCAYLSQLKHDLGARLYTHIDMLGGMQFLPQQATRAGLCGVYIPTVDVLLKNQQGRIESLKIDYKRFDENGIRKIQYQVGSFVV